MGRSFFFDFDQDVIFPDHLPSSLKLSQLQKGQYVKLTIGQNSKPMPLCRTVSTYEYNTSSTNTTLFVDDINYCSSFNKKNIRCIVFRDPSISPENHIYSWCVTTDGYERETEHYGVSGEVLDVEIIEDLSLESDPISNAISTLCPGNHVKLDTRAFNNDVSFDKASLPKGMSISNVNTLLVVDWISDGMISLRDPKIPIENHINVWFLTTNGLIVDSICEPLYKVISINVN